MITLTREEAQQVLDALIDAADSQNWEMQQNIDQHGEWYRRSRYLKQAVANTNSTIETLRARLSAPEPEPVAWLKKDRSSIEVSIMSAEYMKNAGFEPLYTAPPQREWQSLTHEEIAEESGAAKAQNHMVLTLAEGFFCGARWAEAKLKEKNGG
jgi:methionyl-tRNA formyltransferase